MLTIGARRDLEQSVRELADNVVGKNFHTDCGNQGYRHLLEWLCVGGQIDIAVKLMCNSSYPGWGYMLACGATTVWERWEEDMKNLMHSYNHPMFASYDSFFYRYIAGLRMADDACGADKWIIEPKFPSGIDFASASINSVRGPASVVWRRKGNEIDLHAEIPANTTALFRLPVPVAEKNGKIDIRFSLS